MSQALTVNTSSQQSVQRHAKLFRYSSANIWLHFVGQAAFYSRRGMKSGNPRHEYRTKTPLNKHSHLAVLTGVGCGKHSDHTGMSPHTPRDDHLDCFQRHIKLGDVTSLPQLCITIEVIITRCSVLAWLQMTVKSGISNSVRYSCRLDSYENCNFWWVQICMKIPLCPRSVNRMQ